MRCPFCHNADSRVIDSREADEGATTRRRRSCPKCNRIYNLVFQAPKDPTRCDDCGVELSRRKDDCCETARERLKAYHTQTGPAIDYFRNGDFHVLDGVKAPNAIYAEIEAILQAQLTHA